MSDSILDLLFPMESTTSLFKTAKQEILEEFEGVVVSYEKSLELFKDIIERNAERIYFQEDMRMIVKGKLALYRINMQSWLDALRNPFIRTTFESVEVHPLNQLVQAPCKACIQIGNTSMQPGIDFMCSYVLGLLNDNTFFHHEDLHPLRMALVRTYGYVKSPISDVLEKFFSDRCDAEIDFGKSQILIRGTNNWKWRIDFQNPCISGYKIQFQKPRQDWWTTISEDSSNDFTHSEEFDEIFQTVEFLAQCPFEIKEHPSWYHRLFVFRAAINYPPLAKSICRMFESNPWFEADNTDRWGEMPCDNALIEIDELKEEIKVIGGYEGGQ